MTNPLDLQDLPEDEAPEGNCISLLSVIENPK